MRVIVHIKPIKPDHDNLKITKHNTLPISVATMIFLGDLWSSDLALNFLYIDFQAGKSSFSLTLTLKRIIFCSSEGLTDKRLF
jgi:hypothetical protein